MVYVGGPQVNAVSLFCETRRHHVGRSEKERKFFPVNRIEHFNRQCVACEVSPQQKVCQCCWSERSPFHVLGTSVAPDQPFYALFYSSPERPPFRYWRARVRQVDEIA